MKKKLFKILTGLCIFAFAITVNAEVQDSTTINSTETDKNFTDATVTVGTVEAPVYEVAVIWNDLTFNWVYDSETNDFGWKPVPICYNIGAAEENVKDALDNGKKVFTNNTCTERASSYNSDATEYYVLEDRTTTTIGIEDISENGQIVPSIEWNADEKYKDVTANFTYTGEGCVLVPSEAAFNYVKEQGQPLYNGDTCETSINAEGFINDMYYVKSITSMPLTGNEIPDNGRQSGAGSMGVDGITFPPVGFTRNYYFVHLALEGGSTIPTTGDAIGTITVSIRAK